MRRTALQKILVLLFIVMIFLPGVIIFSLHIPLTYAAPSEAFQNGDFESGLTGWHPTGTYSYINNVIVYMLSVNTATKHAGNASMQITPLGEYLQVTTYGYAWQTLAVPVPQSLITSFGFWAYNALSPYDWNAYSDYIISFTDGTTYRGTITNPHSNIYSWVYYDIASLVPSGKTVTGITFEVGGTSARSNALLIDDVSLVANPSHTLSVTSTSSLPVPLLVNGTFVYTPYSTWIGTDTYILNVTNPVINENSTHAWTFQNWYINSTTSNSATSLVMNLTGDTTVEMNYTIGLASDIVGLFDVSSPSVNATFLVNGTSQTTPFMAWTKADTYILNMTNPVIYHGESYAYTFQNWFVNGTTSSNVTSLVLSITGNTTVIMNYTGAPTQFRGEWLIGGDFSPKIKLASFNGSGAIDLTGNVNGTEVSSIASGFGYYLIATNEHTVPGGYMPPPPYDVGKVTTYDGTNFVEIISGSAKITSIARGVNSFLIGGEYSSYGGDYWRGRLYSYNMTGVTDVTSVLGGALNILRVKEVASCGNYWLLGILDDASSTSYVYRYDGVNATSVLTIAGANAPTAIAYSGQYALVASNSSNYVYQYWDDGTVDNLTDAAGISGHVTSMAWNGTHFLLTTDGSVIKLFNGQTWSTISTDYAFKTVGWDGDYWLLGGSLEKLEDTVFTNLTSYVSWDVNALAPTWAGVIDIYVVSSPELNAAFSLAGSSYITPVVIPSYPGTVNFAVRDTFLTVDGVPYAFTSYSYLSDITAYYTAAADIPIINDATITLYYAAAAVPLIPSEVTPAPVPEPEQPFPWWLVVMIIATVLFAIYLYAKQQLWMIGFLTLPEAIVVIILQPLPAWNLYITIALLVVTTISLLYKSLKLK